MRRFNRRQRLENEAFLAALRRTGNPRLAAASLNVHRSTYMKRRARSAAFAGQWDAAILACHASLQLGGGPRPAEGPGLRTKGGEIVVGRTRGGRLQLRRSPPGRMTEAAEQAFFTALSASANVRLSAAATGFAHSSFYHKKRSRPVFAREMRIAITIGSDRLEWALMEGCDRTFGGGPPIDAWQDRIGDTPLPPMSVSQAIQQVTLHHNRDRLRDRPDRASKEVSIEQVRDEIVRKCDAVKRARHYEATGSWRFAHEQASPSLPPLHLVTGWSKATGKPAHNPDLALFGGWRISDWKKRKRRQSI
jgi:hypothetical protein